MKPIRRIRSEIFHVTQEEMAVIAGVEQATVSRWETGVNDPSLHHLERIRTEARRRRLQWDDGLFFATTGRSE